MFSTNGYVGGLERTFGIVWPFSTCTASFHDKTHTEMGGIDKNYRYVKSNGIQNDNTVGLLQQARQSVTLNRARLAPDGVSSGESLS
jgi:hypothetical protein